MFYILCILLLFYSILSLPSKRSCLQRYAFEKGFCPRSPIKKTLTYTEGHDVHYNMSKTMTVRSLIRYLLLLPPQMYMYRSFLHPTCNTFLSILEIIALVYDFWLPFRIFICSVICLGRPCAGVDLVKPRLRLYMCC